MRKNKRDFCGFLWNPRTKELMGRTAGSWCEIFVFYIFFYGLLAAWWAALLYARVSFLPEIEDGPFHTDYISHRGPGLSTVPTADGMKKELIFIKDAEDCCADYIEQIEEFFKEYTTVNGEDMSADFEKCDGSGACADNGGTAYLSGITIEINKTKAAAAESEEEDEGATENEVESEEGPSKMRSRVRRQEDNGTSEDAANEENEGGEEEEEEEDENIEEVKLFNLLNLGPCYSDKTFGYSDGEPCLYFTINNAFGWTPEPMSDDRKEEHSEQLEGLTVTDEFAPVVCGGYKASDKEAIEEIKVYPESGVPVDFYPWTGGENYKKPIVAAKVKLTEDGYNKRVRIECKVYADNFHPSHEKPNSGRVEFSLTINTKSEKETDENVEEEEVEEDAIVPEDATRL